MFERVREVSSHDLEVKLELVEDIASEPCNLFLTDNGDLTYGHGGATAQTLLLIVVRQPGHIGVVECVGTRDMDLC